MSNKKKSSLSKDQLAFTFEAPKPAKNSADLAGLDCVVASGCAQMLKDDARSREEIAGAMSALLSEEVTPLMLDAYAAPARKKHNLPMHRALALVAVTNRFDILNIWARRIGAAVLVGEQLQTALIGNIDRQMAELRKKKKAAEQGASIITWEKP